ncbi:MAG TPA: amino acid ABC transporter substrate-binding protein [Acidimicrobiia bacterium]|nr:amino acid ABC transporter substrate-binding protein [Acidimicrobiia bacterium]
MRASTRWATVLTTLALVIFACGGDTTTDTTGGEGVDTTAAPTDATEAPTATTEGGGAEGDEIVLAASVPLTGDFQVPGTKHRDGYQLCVDIINESGGLLDRPVRLLVEDNRSDPEVAVTQYERFINVDQVDALLGTFSSLISYPTTSVAEQAGYVYPVASGGAQRIWERGYTYSFYFQQQTAEGIGENVLQMIDYYTEQGIIPEGDIGSIAMVYADDFFAAAIINGLTGGEISFPDSDETISLAPGFIADYGYEGVFEEQWPVDFTDWVTLANSVRGAEADMLVTTTASPDEAIALVRALQTVDYQPKLAYFSQGTQIEFYDNLQEASNGTVIHSAYHLQANWEGTLLGEPYSNADFIEAWNAEYGRDPDEDEAIPFAVCQGMTQAIEATGGTDQTAMRDWLAGRTAEEPVRTILGDFYWDERGVPIDRSVIMTQWEDGSLNFVYPVGEFEGTSDLIYPKPEW